MCLCATQATVLHLGVLAARMAQFRFIVILLHSVFLAELSESYSGQIYEDETTCSGKCIAW